MTVVDKRHSYAVRASTRHPIYENFRVKVSILHDSRLENYSLVTPVYSLYICLCVLFMCACVLTRLGFDNLHELHFYSFNKAFYCLSLLKAQEYSNKTIDV